LSSTSYRKFSQEYRNSEEREKCKVNEKKRRTAVLSDYIRETPYIPEPYGATCGKH
jgi:hypothetical protein